MIFNDLAHFGVKFSTNMFNLVFVPLITVRLLPYCAKFVLILQ